MADMFDGKTPINGTPTPSASNPLGGSGKTFSPGAFGQDDFSNGPFGNFDGGFDTPVTPPPKPKTLNNVNAMTGNAGFGGNQQSNSGFGQSSFGQGGFGQSGFGQPQQGGFGQPLQGMPRPSPNLNKQPSGMGQSKKPIPVGRQGPGMPGPNQGQFQPQFQPQTPKLSTAEINQSRAKALQKFSSIILGGLQDIPLMLGNIELTTFMKLMCVLSYSLLLLQLLCRYVFALACKIPLPTLLIVTMVNSLAYLWLRYGDAIKTSKEQKAQYLASLNENMSMFDQASEAKATEAFNNTTKGFVQPDGFQTPESNSANQDEQSETSVTDPEVTEDYSEALSPLPPNFVQEEAPIELGSPKSRNSEQETTDSVNSQQDAFAQTANFEQDSESSFGTFDFGDFNAFGGFAEVKPVDSTEESEEKTDDNSDSAFTFSEEANEIIQPTQSSTSIANSYTPHEVDLSNSKPVDLDSILHSQAMEASNARMESLSNDINQLLDSLRV